MPPVAPAIALAAALAAPSASDSDREAPSAQPAPLARPRAASSTSWHTVGHAAAVRSHLRELRAVACQPDDGAPPTTAVAPSIDRPRAHAWASALIVFAGEGHDLDLAARLRARGVQVTAIDTKAGGASHDVLRGGLGPHLVARVRRGDFDIVFIATPCASYAVAHQPRLRSRRSPLGIANVPTEWRRYLEKHNTLATLTAQLIDAADAAGAAWALENPADRGDPTSRAWWPKFADHAPLWKVPAVRLAIARAGGRLIDFAQCAFGAPVHCRSEPAAHPSQPSISARRTSLRSPICAAPTHRRHLASPSRIIAQPSRVTISSRAFPSPSPAGAEVDHNRPLAHPQRGARRPVAARLRPRPRAP